MPRGLRTGRSTTYAIRSRISGPTAGDSSAKPIAASSIGRTLLGDFRLGEHSRQRLARVDAVAEPHEHFDAGRVVELVAQLLPPAAHGDDRPAELLGVDRRDVPASRRGQFTGRGDGPRRVEVAALAPHHLGELLAGGARVDRVAAAPRGADAERSPPLPSRRAARRPAPASPP